MRILVIDENTMFRDFLVQKLTGFGLDVVAAGNGFDGMVKMQAEHPDLIIMDYYLTRVSAMELLEKRTGNPNTKNCPVIVVANKIDAVQVRAMAELGVKKFFSRPIKIDLLIQSVSDLLGLRLELDNTPCIIDANFNDEILIIEVAMGLNKDKIELLKFRLKELADLYGLYDTKALLILSGIDLSVKDNLQFAALLGNIIDFGRAQKRNIRILTNDTYVASFLESREQYAGIKVAPTLDAAMDSLLGLRSEVFKDTKTNVVHHDFLSAGNSSAKDTGVNLHFDTELKNTTMDISSFAGQLKVAMVDDDIVIRSIVKKAFASKGIEILEFPNGKPFLEHPDHGTFDLVFLDLIMPGTGGFAVLDALKAEGISVPIIILSALDTKETVIKALSYGVKTYMIKPIKPDAILKKASEIVLLNF